MPLEFAKSITVHEIEPVTIGMKGKTYTEHTIAIRVGLYQDTAEWPQEARPQAPHRAGKDIRIALRPQDIESLCQSLREMLPHRPA